MIIDNYGSITSGNAGITIYNSDPIIQNNTITRNSAGLSIVSMVSPQITNNNIEDNLQYSLRLGSTNISATNNWWGTTDTQAINQTIYDFKNDFNLGIVNFVPFLNEPNPQLQFTSMLLLELEVGYHPAVL